MDTDKYRGGEKKRLSWHEVSKAKKALAERLKYLNKKAAEQTETVGHAGSYILAEIASLTIAMFMLEEAYNYLMEIRQRDIDDGVWDDESPDPHQVYEIFENALKFDATERDKKGEE